jgi:hypothetical protein
VRLEDHIGDGGCDQLWGVFLHIVAGVLDPHHCGSRQEVDPGAQRRFIKEIILHPPEQQGRDGVQRVLQFPGHFCAALRDRLAARAWDLQREGEYSGPIFCMQVGCPVGSAHLRSQGCMIHRPASKEEVAQHKMTPPVQVVCQGARPTGKARQLERGGLTLPAREHWAERVADHQSPQRDMRG